VGHLHAIAQEGEDEVGKVHLGPKVEGLVERIPARKALVDRQAAQGNLVWIHACDTVRGNPTAHRVGSAVMQRLERPVESLGRDRATEQTSDETTHGASSPVLPSGACGDGARGVRGLALAVKARR
jgi:hypothetical protein